MGWADLRTEVKPAAYGAYRAAKTAVRNLAGRQHSTMMYVCRYVPGDYFVRFSPATYTVHLPITKSSEIVLPRISMNAQLGAATIAVINPQNSQLSTCRHESTVARFWHHSRSSSNGGAAPDGVRFDIRYAQTCYLYLPRRWHNRGIPA
jgi:hypothetical protein